MSNFHRQFSFLKNTQSSIRKQQQHKQKITHGEEGEEAGRQRRWRKPFFNNPVEGVSCMVGLIEEEEEEEEMAVSDWQ